MAKKKSENEPQIFPLKVVALASVAQSVAIVFLVLLSIGLWSVPVLEQSNPTMTAITSGGEKCVPVKDKPLPVYEGDEEPPAEEPIEEPGEPSLPPSTEPEQSEYTGPMVAIGFDVLWDWQQSGASEFTALKQGDLDLRYNVTNHAENFVYVEGESFECYKEGKTEPVFAAPLDEYKGITFIEQVNQCPCQVIGGSEQCSVLARSAWGNYDQYCSVGNITDTLCLDADGQDTNCPSNFEVYYGGLEWMSPGSWHIGWIQFNDANIIEPVTLNCVYSLETDAGEFEQAIDLKFVKQ